MLPVYLHYLLSAFFLKTSAVLVFRTSTIGETIYLTSSMSSTITAVDVEATSNIEQVGVSLFSIKAALISRNEICNKEN